ncbi:MAG: acyl-CoA dehydrogenase family protein [Granulosicoccus sp.]
MINESAFCEDVATFANTEVQAEVAQWSLGQSPTDALYRLASSLGLTAIAVPVEYGGLGLSFSAKVSACASLAAQDFGFAMSIINSHNVAVRLCTSAPDSVCERFLPGLLDGTTKSCTAITEPETGSDIAAIQTRAERKGDQWTLHGHKTWIVNGRDADSAIVFAQTESNGDRNGIGAFFVDLSLSGVQRCLIESGFSQASIGTGSLKFDGVNISGDCLLLSPGNAFKTILTEINGARVYVAAMCDAMLDKALQQVTLYGSKRHTFGKPLNAHASWNRIVEDAQSALAESAAITAHASHQVEALEDAQLSAMNAKVNSVETCQHYLPGLLHAMGAEGLRPEYCFTRHLAAVHLASLTDGATNMLKDRIEKLSNKV